MTPEPGKLTFPILKRLCGPGLVVSDDEALAADLLAAADAVRDPLWRMPLWPGYRAAIDSDIADVRNDSAAWAQGGSITAALFLQKFAPTSGAWAHLDAPHPRHIHWGMLPRRFG